MPSYLVTAPDPLLLDEQVGRLTGGRDVESYYAADISLRELIGRVSTLDLFSGARAFWLKEIAALPATKKTARELAQLVGALPGSSLLVFSQDTYFGGDWQARKKFQSGLKKGLASLVQREVEVNPMKPPQLARWVQERAKEHHRLNLPAHQVQALVESCAELPSLIDKELEKLALLKPRQGAGTITEAWFKASLAPTWSYQVGRIVDAVLAREPEAYHLLIRLYRRESITARLLPELYRGLLKLYWLLTDSESRSRPEFVRAPGWQMDKLRRAAQRWRGATLLKALRVITDTEFRQRTGRMGGKTPLDGERDLLLLMLRRLYAL